MGPPEPKAERRRSFGAMRQCLRSSSGGTGGTAGEYIEYIEHEMRSTDHWPGGWRGRGTGIVGVGSCCPKAKAGSTPNSNDAL